MIVNVNFFDKNVGLLMWDTEKGVALFQYNKEFLRSNIDIAPVMMPLNKSGENRVYQFLGNRNGCFCGLPGLIMEAEDNNFVYTARNVEYTSSNLQIVPPSKGQILSREKFDRLQEKKLKEMGVDSKEKGGVQIIRL